MFVFVIQIAAHEVATQREQDQTAEDHHQGLILRKAGFGLYGLTCGEYIICLRGEKAIAIGLYIQTAKEGIAKLQVRLVISIGFFLVTGSQIIIVKQNSRIKAQILQAFFASIIV